MYAGTHSPTYFYYQCPVVLRYDVVVLQQRNYVDIFSYFHMFQDLRYRFVFHLTSPNLSIREVITMQLVFSIIIIGSIFGKFNPKK